MTGLPLLGVIAGAGGLVLSLLHVSPLLVGTDRRDPGLTGMVP
ncbi:MAG: hypothetical protein VX929_14970 [Pseudomonadota bacterium]|nr:hypothetical protein [Pseudomonadota bacterium]